MIDQALAQALQKEIPVLTAQIRSLYAEFVKNFISMERRSPLLLVWSQTFLDRIQEAVTTKKSIFIFPCCLSAMR